MGSFLAGAAGHKVKYGVTGVFCVFYFGGQEWCFLAGLHFCVSSPLTQQNKASKAEYGALVACFMAGLCKDKFFFNTYIIDCCF
jgi:hypothetical protein